MAETRIGDTIYQFDGRRLDWKIDPTPGKIVYLGHIRFTEAASEAAKRRARITLYEFEPSVSVDWNRQDLMQHITDQDADSPWLSYEIVEYGKR